MPLFDFRCRSCSHEFEALVRPGGTPACPECQNADLDRLPSTFAPSSEGMRRSALTTARQNASKARAERRRVEHGEMVKHIRDEH
jgi:putative FmdB family regulatory protein